MNLFTAQNKFSIKNSTFISIGFLIAFIIFNFINSYFPEKLNAIFAMCLGTVVLSVARQITGFIKSVFAIDIIDSESMNLRVNNYFKMMGLQKYLVKCMDKSSEKTFNFNGDMLTISFKNNEFKFIYNASKKTNTDESIFKSILKIVQHNIYNQNLASYKL